MIEESEGSTNPTNSPENASVSPENFDFLKPELRPLWKKRFERYLSSADAASAKSDAEKLDALRCIMGEETDQVLAQLMPDTKDKTLTVVLQAFSDYFFPQKNVILERYRFNSRIQESDESVDQFIAALRILAESCRYGMMKDELIRDQLIVGLLDTKTSVVLRLKSHLTLEEAVAIARQADPPCLQPESNDDAEGNSKDNVLLFPSMTWITGPFWNISINKRENVRYECYKKVQKVLNNLCSENFETSVKQLQALKIDSEEMLQGVIDLIYATSIAKPQLIPLCALMCLKLSMLQVSCPRDKGGVEEHPTYLKDLVRNREFDFEKDFEGIEKIADPNKRRVTLLAYLGLMYSLCKQGMVPTNLVVHAVEHCIKQMDKGSLDCLQQYYIEMLNIHRYESPEFCLKLIPMLQDVPELNSNKRKDDLQTLHHIMRQMKTKSLNRQPYKINHQRPSYMQKSEPENRPPATDNGQWPKRGKNFLQGSRTVSDVAPKTSTPNKAAEFKDTSNARAKRPAALLPSGSKFTGPRNRSHQDFKNGEPVRGAYTQLVKVRQEPHVGTSTPKAKTLSVKKSTPTATIPSLMDIHRKQPRPMDMLNQRIVGSTASHYSNPT